MRELPQLLASVLQEVDKGGWDQSPQLVTIVKTNDFAVVESAPLTVTEPADDFPLWVADMFMQEPAMPAALLRKQPGLFGFAFVYEAWVLPDDAAVSELKAHQGHADHPAARECRGVYAVTLDGDGILIQRFRDDVTFGQVHWEDQGGPIFAGLVAMTLLIARHTTVNPKALAQLNHMREVLTAQATDESVQP